MFCEMLIMCASCRRACNPVDLFDAAVQKRCLDDFVNIKVIMLCQNNFGESSVALLSASAIDSSEFFHYSD